MGIKLCAAIAIFYMWHSALGQESGARRASSPSFIKVMFNGEVLRVFSREAPELLESENKRLSAMFDSRNHNAQRAKYEKVIQLSFEIERRIDDRKVTTAVVRTITIGVFQGQQPESLYAILDAQVFDGHLVIVCRKYGQIYLEIFEIDEGKIASARVLWDEGGEIKRQPVSEARISGERLDNAQVRFVVHIGEKTETHNVGVLQVLEGAATRQSDSGRVP